jgi:invasion protein IalB
VAFDKTPTFLLGASNFGLNWKSAAMRVFAAAAVLLGLPALAPAPAYAEPRIQSERFDDWYYRCVTPEAGKGQASPKPQCEVVQIAQAKQGQETVNVLTISVSETVHENKKAAVITILAPQNVYLPGGLGLSIDQQNKLGLHYRNCNNAGCWIQHVLDNKTLETLKSGEAGFASIHPINGQNLNIKFSLKGFKEAYKALQSGKYAKKP